jgi:hypothetical protein
VPTTLSSFGGQANEVAKTASYTVLAADNGTLFTNAGAAGAIAFTLPILSTVLGFSVEFLATTAQVLSIASNESTNIVADGAANKSSVIFSTGSHIIGGRVRISANGAGTLWLLENKSALPAVDLITFA